MIGHLGHPSIGHPNNQHEVYDFHSLGKVWAVTAYSCQITDLTLEKEVDTKGIPWEH